MSFDDGLTNQYTVARPILLQKHIPATFYIVSDALFWGGNDMNTTQVRQLVADGDEIGNHTRDHANLATLSAAAIDAEFADAQSAIQSRVGVTPTTCAYPNGASNSTVDSIVAKYFRSCRTTQPGFNTRATPNYGLVTLYMQQTTSVATVRQAAETAKANNSWLILTYHGVESPNSTYVDNVSAANFSAQMDALIASGIPIETVTTALTAMGK